MKSTPESDLPANSPRSSPWPWIIAVGCLLITFIAILLPQQHDQNRVQTSADKPASRSADHSSRFDPAAQLHHTGSAPSPAPTAAEIVAAKVKQFGRIRRETARAIARHLKKDVPPAVEKFFDSLDGGNWEEIRAQFHEIATHAGRYEYSTAHEPDLDPFFRPVVEAFGAAEQAHSWPPQQLLDYGNSVLDSLRPGMVYVGGTDPGCFIPTMMNETSDGEHHIVLTQNALADSDYLDYLGFLYGDQLAMPGHDDAQLAFQNYAADAANRYLHDQQFPDEPKQLQPGENVTFDTDGQPHASGVTAVMGINELILQNLLQKNPDLAFAMEESLSLPSTYVGAAPLGPIFEMRAQDGQNAMTPDTVAQSLDYWRATTQQLLADPVSANSPGTIRSWSHDLSAEANLFAANDFPDQAEQAYRLAAGLWPGDANAAAGYVNLLIGENRLADAAQVAANALNSAPDNTDLKNLAQRVAGLQAAANFTSR
jgi:hypothetical protein